MPAIRDFAFTEGTTTAASYQPDMPVHETDDLLIAFCNNDAVGFGAAPANWSTIYAADYGAHGAAVYYFIATSSSVTSPTITLASAETYTCTVVSVKNIDTNDPINTNALSAADDSTNPFDGVAVTTDADDCLIFSFLTTDGGIGPTCEPPWTNITNGDAGANSGGLAYQIKKALGAVAANTWRGQFNENTRSISVAINDDGAGTPISISPYIQSDTTNGTLLESGYWITLGGANAWGNIYQTSLSLAAIGAKTTAFDAAALQTDQGLNPYWAVADCTPAASAAGSTVGGPQLNFASASDLSGGIVLFNYFFVTSRDYVDISKTTDSGQCGLLFVARDGTAYRAWSVGAKGTVTTKPDGYNHVGIQVDQSTDTRFATSGSIVATAIDSILTLAQGRYGAVSFRWGNLVIVYEQALAGGTSTNPLSFDDLDFVLNASVGQQRIMLREGSAATFLAPIKIGGTDPIHLSVNLRTLQFRTQADELDYLDWHVDDNKVGFEFDGQANDTISFTNSVFVGGSPFYWRFNSGHSASAILDFGGTTIINATVTLRSTVTLDNITFIACNEIVLNDANLSNSTFANQRVGDDYGAVAFTSAAEAGGITTCEFIDNHDGDLGHSIRITAAGTYTFNGHTFSGGGPAAIAFHTQTDVDADNDEIDATGHGYTDGDAIYYQDQGGTDTIGLTDGNMYYVNAVTVDSLAFYPTKADALADTNQVALSDGAAGQTHFLYSAKADVYNNSGGAVTINVTNEGDIPTIRNSDGSSTTVNQPVTLTITGVTENTQCWVYTGTTELMNTTATTLVSGDTYQATATYNYTTDTAITVRTREMGYLPFETTGTITNDGLTVTAVWQVDPNWKIVLTGVNITFNENPPSADTIVRASGDFATDGWLQVMGQVTVEGSASNNGTYEIATIATDTITLAAAEDLTQEGPVAGVTLTFTRRSLT
ncbi:hypothetical protein A2W24_06450 [Microgenomates group bacterium RBG_16_45_19]|nr:MAG: hypothetical protein A2W24_06450 [Microgenomates group bacterium RBG_16_45_19]